MSTSLHLPTRTLPSVLCACASVGASPSTPPSRVSAVGAGRDPSQAGKLTPRRPGAGPGSHREQRQDRDPRVRPHPHTGPPCSSCGGGAALGHMAGPGDPPREDKDKHNAPSGGSTTLKIGGTKCVYVRKIRHVTECNTKFLFSFKIKLKGSDTARAKGAPCPPPTGKPPAPRTRHSAGNGVSPIRPLLTNTQEQSLISTIKS